MLKAEHKAWIQKWGPLSIATGAFSGFIPFAPGTWGSAVGLALLWLMPPVSFLVYLLLTLLCFFVGVWAANRARQVFKIVDAPQIVIDEIAGIMVTMIGIPLTGYWLVWGFVLFRIFDIAKPPPAKFFDSRVKNAWGVMLDDTIAGIYGNIILHLMLMAKL